MNDEMLVVDCTEWRDVAEDFPDQMEVVVEMMIESQEKLCHAEAA